MNTYPIPKKKGNTRLVHLYDVAALVVLVYFLWILFPVGTALDFGAGTDGSSQVYAQTLTEQLEQNAVGAGYFSHMFNCCTIQNGGAVYSIAGDDLYFRYVQDGKKGSYQPFYRSGGNYSGNEKNSTDVPMGLMTRAWYLTVLEDGTVFYDNLEGFYGESDYVIDVDGEVDYMEITQLLIRSDTEALNLKDTARLLYLIQENILIGYCDGTAWFRVNDTDCVWARSYTAEGQASESRFYENVGKILAVNNQGLLFDADGEVWICSLSLNSYKGVGFADSVDSWGKLVDFGYAMKDGQLQFFGLTENKMIHIVLEPETMSAIAWKEHDVNYGHPYGVYVTYGEDVTAWVSYEGGYHFYIVQD